MSDNPEQKLPKAFIYIEFREPGSVEIVDFQSPNVSPLLMLGVCSMLELQAKMMFQQQWSMQQKVQVPDSRTTQQILRAK